MDTWFDSRHVLANEESGLYFADLRKISVAFDIPSVSSENQTSLFNNNSFNNDDCLIH